MHACSIIARELLYLEKFRPDYLIQFRCFTDQVTLGIIYFCMCTFYTPRRLSLTAKISKKSGITRLLKWIWNAYSDLDQGILVRTSIVLPKHSWPAPRKSSIPTDSERRSLHRFAFRRQRDHHGFPQITPSRTARRRKFAFTVYDNVFVGEQKEFRATWTQE